MNYCGFYCVFQFSTQINITSQELWEEVLCLKGLIGKGLLSTLNCSCSVLKGHQELLVLRMSGQSLHSFYPEWKKKYSNQVETSRRL